jgi:hypothetical protein
MRRLALAVLLTVIAGGSHTLAADSMAVVAPPAKTVTSTTVVTTPASVETVTVLPQGPTIVVTKPEPHVPYGCKRIWRCDKQVCEWRRGCWGVYGYMEGPYYSQELAQRQWERDGWPVPGGHSARNQKVLEPSLSK